MYSPSRVVSNAASCQGLLQHWRIDWLLERVRPTYGDGLWGLCERVMAETVDEYGEHRLFDNPKA